MLSLDEALRVRALYRELGSLAAVARATGYDVATVRRALHRDYAVRPRRRRPVPIDARLRELITSNRPALRACKKNRLTPARAHALLASEGVRVSLRTVERRFAAVSALLGEECGRPASLLLTAPPGSFQVDFGAVSAVLSGTPRDLSVLICSSAYSNGCVAVACWAQDACNLFWGLDACFVALGGVPPVLRFDNLAPAVSMRGGRQKTDAFSRFEQFHGFASEFCAPASGWEKGNVENKVQYVRERFFVPIPSAPSLGALNDSLARWCVADMERPHYRAGRLISDLFDEERASFLRFRGQFDYWETTSGKTDARAFVAYRGAHYFAGERCARLAVVIRASVQAVEIYAESSGALLATHPRSYTRGEWVQPPASLASMLAKKLNALGSVGRCRADGLALRDALRPLDADSRIPYILRFLEGARVADILSALEEQRAPLSKYDALLKDKNNGN